MPASRPRQPDDPVEIGAYKLVGYLGSGGQGVVYLGVAPSRERVAVKMLHSRLFKDPKTRERFLREIAGPGRPEVCPAGLEGRPVPRVDRGTGRGRIWSHPRRD